MDFAVGCIFSMNNPHPLFNCIHNIVIQYQFIIIMANCIILHNLFYNTENIISVQYVPVLYHGQAIFKASGFLLYYSLNCRWLLEKCTLGYNFWIYVECFNL